MVIENRMIQQHRNGRSDEEWFMVATEIKNALTQGTYFQKEVEAWAQNQNQAMEEGMKEVAMCLQQKADISTIDDICDVINGNDQKLN